MAISSGTKKVSAKIPSPIAIAPITEKSSQLATRARDAAIALAAGNDLLRELIAMMTLTREHDERETTHETSQADSGIERRRGLRIAQQRPIKVLEHGSCRYYPGQTADVSATGLRITIPVSAPVTIGATLSVHVGLSEAGQSLANRRTMIPARVVWVDRASVNTETGFARPGTMMLGLEFLSSISAQLDAA